MENKKTKRYLYFLFEDEGPVYLKEKALLDVLEKYPCFEINGDNCSAFIDDLNLFLDGNYKSKRKFIIIDTEKISIEEQNRLCSIVKDKSYQATFLPDNCKVVVLGKREKMDKELLSLLVVIDV